MIDWHGHGLKGKVKTQYQTAAQHFKLIVRANEEGWFKRVPRADSKNPFLSIVVTKAYAEC